MKTTTEGALQHLGSLKAHLEAAQRQHRELQGRAEERFHHIQALILKEGQPDDGSKRLRSLRADIAAGIQKVQPRIHQRLYSWGHSLWQWYWTPRAPVAASPPPPNLDEIAWTSRLLLCEKSCLEKFFLTDGERKSFEPQQTGQQRDFRSLPVEHWTPVENWLYAVRELGPNATTLLKELMPQNSAAAKFEARYFYSKKLSKDGRKIRGLLKNQGWRNFIGN